MFENTRTLQSNCGAWPKESGMAWIEFEHSHGIYWLQFVPKGEKFSVIIPQASEKFQAAVGKPGQFVLIDRIPAGVEELDELSNGLTLLKASWVQARFVVIGCGGMEVFKEGFRKWEKKA